VSLISQSPQSQRPRREPRMSRPWSREKARRSRRSCAGSDSPCPSIARRPPRLRIKSRNCLRGRLSDLSHFNGTFAGAMASRRRTCEPVALRRQSLPPVNRRVRHPRNARVRQQRGDRLEGPAIAENRAIFLPASTGALRCCKKEHTFCLRSDGAPDASAEQRIHGPVSRPGVGATSRKALLRDPLAEGYRSGAATVVRWSAVPMRDCAGARSSTVLAGCTHSGVARTRLIDDWVAEAWRRVVAACGARAGFDSRAWRLPDLSGLPVSRSTPSTAAGSRAASRRWAPIPTCRLGRSRLRSRLLRSPGAAGFDATNVTMVVWKVSRTT